MRVTSLRVTKTVRVEFIGSEKKKFKKILMFPVLFEKEEETVPHKLGRCQTLCR